MSGVLLDTCVWLWIQRGIRVKLSDAFLEAFQEEQRSGRAFISAISALELARLVTWNSYNLGMSIETFLAEGTTDGALQVLPASPQILIDSVRLPGNIHRDPMDRILVATARIHNLTLVTTDKSLLAYAKEGHLNARRP